MNRSGGLCARVAVAALTVAALGGFAGVSTAAPDTGSASGSGGSSGSAPGNGILGRWAGTWTVTSGSYPGTLDVSSESPFHARINIPSRPCVATWDEIGRTGADAITVRASVVSGSCSNNTWNLTLGTSVITGSDPDNSRNTVVFTR